MKNKKVILISEVPLYNESGIKVLDKTIEMLVNNFELKAVIGLGNFLGKKNHFKISDKLFIKLDKYKYIGYLYYNFIFSFYFLAKTIYIIKRYKIDYDFVYAIGPLANWIAGKISKADKIIISRYLGIAWDSKNIKSFKQKLKFIFRRVWYKSRSNLIIVTDDGTQGNKFLRSIGITNRQIILLKNGIDKNQAFEISDRELKNLYNELGLDKDSKVLLTVSRLASWKRVDRAISIMPYVIKFEPKVRLIIVGDGEEKPKLQQLTKKLMISNYVNFVGAIERNKIFYFYKMADIFLSFYDYSNAGNPLFEAMLFKKPIITINNGDTGKFISSNEAILLNEFEIFKVVEAIKYLFNNYSHRLKLGLNAYNRVVNDLPSWEDRMEYEKNLINSIIYVR